MANNSRAKRMLAMLDEDENSVNVNLEVTKIMKNRLSSPKLQRLPTEVKTRPSSPELQIVPTENSSRPSSSALQRLPEGTTRPSSPELQRLPEDTTQPSSPDLQRLPEVTTRPSSPELQSLLTENSSRPSSPELQNLSSFADIQSILMNSPSAVSFDSTIFDNVDFVASPKQIFCTPRKPKLLVKQRAFLAEVTSEVVTPKSSCHNKETTKPKSGSTPMTGDKCSPNKISDSVLPNLIIVQCEKIDDDGNDQNTYTNTITFDADFLSESSEIPTAEGSPTICSLSVNELFIEPLVTDTDLTVLPLSNQSVTDHSISPTTSTSNTKELTRKRKRFESDWESSKSKKQKNLGKEYTGYHSKKEFNSLVMKETCNCAKKCGEKITQEKREEIFKEFWKLGDHEHQWHYILRHTAAKEIKKMQLDRTKNRTQTIIYNFRIDNASSSTVNVCKKFFLNTLTITEKVVYTAIEKGKSEEVKDNRGVHSNRPRKMSVPTEQSVIAHIKMFPVKESHYVRKDSKKMYLEETLNISKMYRLYQEWFQSEGQRSDCDDDVKMASKRQYETVFNTRFNYSFHKPKKDMCGPCSIYEHADEERKEQLKEEHNKHIENKKAVRQLKAQDKTDCDPSTTTVAIFDLEKVLTIPQSEVGIFHYKRKYPIYNFTVYDTTNGKGYCYTWHYQIAKRGASEIGSCLLKFIESECKRGIVNFHFYSDGCTGQNKNRMIFALYMFLARKYGINIIHRYFETGHSQSEGDAMHSCIERAKKNHTIYTPDQMYGIILNAKVNGEKFKLLEMEQNQFFDLRDLMNKRYWLRMNESNEKVMWSKLHEIKVSHDDPDVIYFKYDFADEFRSINTLHNVRSVRGRRRGTVEDVSSTDDVLKNAYTDVIAIPKPLYDDLMSLCRTEAIPKHYHSFYNNLHTAGCPTEDSDRIEDSDED